MNNDLTEHMKLFVLSGKPGLRGGSPRDWHPKVETLITMNG